MHFFKKRWFKYTFLLNLFFNQKLSNFYFVFLFVLVGLVVGFFFSILLFVFCAVFHTPNHKGICFICYRYGWVCLQTTEWLKRHLKTLFSHNFQSCYDILAGTWPCPDPQPDKEIQSVLILYHLGVCTSAGINRKEKLILYFECSKFYFGTDSIWSIRTNMKLHQKQPLTQKWFFRLEHSNFVLF